MLICKPADGSSVERIRMCRQAEPANQGQPQAGRDPERVEEGEGRKKPVDVLFQFKMRPGRR